MQQIRPVLIRIRNDFSLDPSNQPKLLPYMNQQEFMELSDLLQNTMHATFPPDRVKEHKRNVWLYEAINPLLLVIFLFLIFMLHPQGRNNKNNDIEPLSRGWTITFLVLLFIVGLCLAYIGQIVGHRITDYCDEEEQVATPVLEEATRKCSGKPGELVFVYKQTKASMYNTHKAVKVLIKQERIVDQVSGDYQELV